MGPDRIVDDTPRRAFLGRTAAAFAGAVSGCTGLSGDSPPTDDSPTTDGELRVFHYWMGASEQSPAVALRRGFEERHPSIETYFRGTHAAGAGYRTVVRRKIDEEGWSSFADHPGRALGFYGSSIGDVEHAWDATGLADALPEAVVRACTSDGSRVAVPFAADRLNLLFYNPEILDAGGVDPASLTDVEALIDAFDAVRERTDAAPLALPTQFPAATYILLEVVLLAQSGPRTYGDVVGGDPRAAPVRRAFETVETFVTDYAPNDPKLQGLDAAADRVANGDAAFAQLPGSLAHEFQEEGATYGEQWDWMPFPGTNGSFDTGLDAFLRPADNPTPEKTEKWLRFVGSAAGQRLLDDPRMGIPVRTDVSTDGMGEFRTELVADYRSASTRPRTLLVALTNEQYQNTYDAVSEHARPDSFDVSSATAAFVDALE